MLKTMVCIQSGTANKSGVDQVAAFIKKEMTALGFVCEQIPNTQTGDHIVARSSAVKNNEKQILMIGHMDTVFPEDTAFNDFKQEKDHSYGPGVADMKGGLVVGIYALKALKTLHDLDSTPVTFIFNSDEETGSETSKALIQAEAKKSTAAFVFEAGGLNNEVVTGRKGNFAAELSITGKAGHAAFAGPDKASAILDLAHKIIAIESLNAPDKGISANAGTITGGIGRNTVAPSAVSQLDFRFLAQADFKDLKAKLEQIVSQPDIPGTTSSLKVLSGRPPMPQTPANKALFEKLDAIGKRLSIPVVEELRQGVSDANLVADMRVPVLDGLGPIGAKDHSEDEYIITQSLFDRTVLFSAFLSEMRS